MLLLFITCFFIFLIAMNDTLPVCYSLQPENILCDGEGRVVLADFGFSKFTGKGNKMGEICGTVGYAGKSYMFVCA